MISILSFHPSWQFIPNDDGANLLDLVRLRQRTAWLQIQDFGHAGLTEDVMASVCRSARRWSVRGTTANF
jgi:hypothetical protein